MKLTRFSAKTKSYGVLDEDQVICLPTLARTLKQLFPSTLKGLISQGLNETRIDHLIQNATKTTLEKALVLHRRAGYITNPKLSTTN